MEYRRKISKNLWKKFKSIVSKSMHEFANVASGAKWATFYNFATSQAGRRDIALQSC